MDPNTSADARELMICPGKNRGWLVSEAEMRTRPLGRDRNPFSPEKELKTT